MKNENAVLYGIIGLMAGIILTIIFASNAVNNNMTGAMGMMGMRTSNERNGMVATIDRHFIEQMIPHHEGAIEMAKLAQERATQPEIKTLAINVIKSQSEEIVQMRSWYKEWYGYDVPEETNDNVG